MAGKVNYEQLLTEFGPSQFESLRPAQQNALEHYAERHTETADLAIELPTGAGKSLIALLIAEAWRREGKRVAILTGNKTLARQMRQEATDLGLTPILMEGRGVDIPPRAKRQYQRSRGIAIMNYWVYFNQNPVIDPADLLFMDDAHLAEHCLHSLYSISIDRYKHSPLYDSLVSELVIKKSIEYGVPPRIEIGEVEQAKRYIDLGVRHFCIGWDRFIYQTHLEKLGEGIRKLVDTL